MVGIDQVLEKLSTVIDPDLKKDIVSMGMIKDLELNDGNLKFTLELTTPACPFNVEIEDDVRKAIADITELKNFDLKVTAKVMEGRSLEDDMGMTTVKNIIGVASGKGGVGKSTVSSNLAVALSKLGLKVGLLDADIHGPSQPRMMGVSKRPASPDGKTIIPLKAHGVTMMSLGLMLKEDEAVIWRGPMLMGALQQMLNQVEWGQLDVLLIDLPPGTGDVQLTLSQKTEVSGAIIVSTPQDVALLDARKAINMFERMEVPIIGMIENMSSYHCPKCGHEAHIFGHGGAQDDAKKFNLPFLGEIPLELEIREAGDGGTPVAATESKHSEVYLNLAQKLIDSKIL